MGAFFLVWKCRAICPFSYCLILCSIFCKKINKANHHTPFCRVKATIHMHFSPLINATQAFSGWFEVLFQRKNKEFWLRLLAGIEFYRIKLLIFMASLIKSKISGKKNAQFSLVYHVIFQSEGFSKHFTQCNDDSSAFGCFHKGWAQQVMHQTMDFLHFWLKRSKVFAETSCSILCVLCWEFLQQKRNGN